MVDRGSSSAVPSLREIFSILKLKDTDCWVFGVQRFLDEGNDINEQSVEGFTTLHRATEERQWDTVQLLLDRGASVDVKTMQGRTALFHAVEAKHTEFVRQMLLKGADVNVQDIFGNTVLHEAATGDSDPLMEILFNTGKDVNCKNIHGQTQLHRIKSDINSKLVAMLLESGATVNCKDKVGITPLHKAAYNSSHQIVAMLLEFGATVNCKDNDGITPLHKAVYNIYSLKTVEILLESGAEVNCKQNSGQTALHIATQLSQLKTIEALLEAGALLDVESVNGRTPVSYPTRYNVKAIEYLILKGARIDEKDKDSLTPLERCLISEHGHTELLIKLSSANLLKGNNKINLMDEDIKMKIGDKLERVMNYEITCIIEVNKMKAHKIGSLSLFSVLSDSADPGFASRADEIQEVLDEAEKQNKYPIYISLLKSKLKEGVCRKALLDDACDILPRLIPTLTLPEIRRMTLARLSNNDLENIIIAFYLAV